MQVSVVTDLRSTGFSINRTITEELTMKTQMKNPMKRPMLKMLIALLFAIPFTVAQAQIPPAVTNFNGETGKLQIPALLFSGRIYYLELSVVDAAALTMKIETNSLVDVTSDGSTAGKTPMDLVGTWKVNGEESTLTLNSNGTFVLVSSADAESCPNGGNETGTFRYTVSTGVFMPTFLTDENGDCGLSDSGGVIRIFTDGNAMTIRFQSDDDANLTLVE